jgi:type III secretory pathway component EscS
MWVGMAPLMVTSPPPVAAAAIISVPVSIWSGMTA